VLLVAMVAAIGLTQRSRKDTKVVDAGDQVKVRSQDRVRIVKMQAEENVEAADCRVRWQQA
jgi:NADH-quinone oxidoreductase subunit J